MEQTTTRRVRLLAVAALLGAVVGGAAIAFLTACEAVTRTAVTGVAGYRPGGPAGEPALVPTVADGPLRPWFLVPVAAAGGLVVGWLTSRFAPEVAGAGTDPVVRAYHDPDGRIRGRIPALKILATAVTIGTGGSGGREGPMIQAGAGIGSWLADRFGLGPADRRLLLAAGMGAGVSAAFRTPLAGTLFAAEVLYRSEEFEPEVLIPAAVAAVTAAAAAATVLGTGPILPAAAAGPWSPLHVFAYALFAVIMVVLARLYVATFLVAQGWRPRWLSGPVGPAVGAAAAALLGVCSYHVAGRDERALAVLGYGLGTLQDALVRPDGFTAGLLAAIALGKLVATVLTVGSGGSGGVFGPALVIGGCAGGALGLALQPLGPDWVPLPTGFVVLGMAGLFAAAAKTPFSTAVIVTELTRDLGLLGPALGVCVVSYVLSGNATLFASQPESRADSPVHPPPDRGRRTAS